MATEQSELDRLRRRVAELEEQLRSVQPNGHPGEVALHPSEEMYRSLFYDAILSSTPDLVYVFDLQHRFTYANQALLTMWGKSWEEAIGKNCLELGYEPWHAAMHDREIEQVIATKQPIRGEVPFTGTHGQRFYDYIFVPVIGANGQVEAVAGTTRDVTERKHAEAELRESEERYRTLFNSIDQGFCIIEMKMEPGERLDYRFIEINKAFEEQSTLLDAEGKWMRELRPGHEEHWFEIYRDVALTGKPIRFEQRGQELQDRWFDLYAFRLGPPEQKRVGVLFTDISERKRAEEDLRRSEERSRLMADVIPQIVWVTDAEGRVEFFNRQWSEYTGVPYEPTTADEVGEQFVHPEDQRATAEAFEEALRTGTTFLVEHRIRSFEGHYRWFLVRAEPYRDPSTGQLVRWFGSSTDIHDRKQAEAQQQFLLTLSDAIRPLRDPEAIKAAASHVLGQQLQANRTFYAEVEGDDWVVEGGYAHGVAPLPPGRYGADTYGRRIMETFRAGKRMVINDTRSDLGFSPEEREALIAIRVLASAGVPLVKDGKLVAILTVQSTVPRNWTEDQITLVEDTAERTWAAVERARAETALRQSDERLAFALEAGGGIGTFDWDVPGDRLYLDARFAQLFSVEPELAASGAPLSEFVASIHPDDRAAVSDKVQQACKTGEYAAEYRVLQPDGSVRWVFARGRCHQDAAGNPTRFLGVIVDVIPHVLDRKELERVNKELEEFAYVASHDLQEPLRMVNVYTQLLIRRHVGDEPQAKQYAAIIHRGVARMEALIHDLLTFSRTIHSDESESRIANLSEALSEATSVLKGRIEESGATISAPVLPSVRGDTAQMAHVFQNLLSNALKYQSDGARPEVHITAKCDGASWIISVKDNGIGFQSQYAERIFGLFKRLHKEDYPGTGLGLAICRRIVERHGGRIWAESTPGEGSTFYLSLPRPENL